MLTSKKTDALTRNGFRASCNIPFPFFLLSSRSLLGSQKQSMKVKLNHTCVKQAAVFDRSTKSIVLSLLWTGFHKAPLGNNYYWGPIPRSIRQWNSSSNDLIYVISLDAIQKTTFESHLAPWPLLSKKTLWGQVDQSQSGEGMFTVVVVRLFLSCSVFQ